ncbi:MAG: FAD/NAD(P)-binding protein [Candidatus Hydrogenedentes bacterium]|nr:FAD/NAD(P)-binding protein [Candidatus Hydrogenedentota bacterium]
MIAVATDPMVPQPFRIHKTKPENADTFTFELAPVNGAKRSAFQPGQFNMLYVYGVGEVAISISGDPANPNTLVHTTRAVGTVTKRMKKLKGGAVLGVRGPFGTYWPLKEAEGNDILIVTGGIGLAPLRPALYYVLANRTQYGRVVLLYGARTPGDILYRRELESWRGKLDLEVHVTVDRATGTWRGNVGVVTSLINRAPFDPENTVALVCGPEVMMQFTMQELEKKGVPADHVFLSMERNMKCALGFCGHCQWGPKFVCRDGPVFRYDLVEDLLTRRGI